MKKSSVYDCTIVELDKHHHTKGNISVVENGKDIPFVRGSQRRRPEVGDALPEKAQRRPAAYFLHPAIDKSTAFPTLAFRLPKMN